MNLLLIGLQQRFPDIVYFRFVIAVFRNSVSLDIFDTNDPGGPLLSYSANTIDQAITKAMQEVFRSPAE